MGWDYTCVGIDSRSLAWVGIRPVCRGCYGCIGIWPVCRGQLHITGYVLGMMASLQGLPWGCWPCVGRMPSMQRSLTWVGIRPVCRGWQDVAGHALGSALCAGVGSTSLTMSWVGKRLLAMGWEDAHMQGLTSVRSLAWVGIRAVHMQRWPWVGICPVCRGQQHITAYARLLAMCWEDAQYAEGLAAHHQQWVAIMCLQGLARHCWPWVGRMPICGGWQVPGSTGCSMSRQAAKQLRAQRARLIC
ncbi:hypothetical protein EDC04DRAFT_2611159 [Pisolithus marmoratus]|nr:hypothetical protein EDC04DRAFT_2611159 [Pisolithus marmoratus]